MEDTPKNEENMSLDHAVGEPGSLVRESPPSAIEEAIVISPNSFHEKVLRKYKEWMISNSGEKQQIYRPPSFNGNWDSVPPEEYILHRLSIIGIPETVGAEDIGKILAKYRTEILTPERLSILQDAYASLNKNLIQYGLSAGSFDPNRVVLVQEQRINEIAGQSRDRLAYTLKGEVGEILIPYDSEELNLEPNTLFDVIVHELGHQVRQKNALDIDASMVLEEGIIQAKAKEVEVATGRTSRRTNEVYTFEAQVATELATNLKVPSLFNLPHSKIKELMGIRYGIAGEVSNPYDDLIYDMIEYLKLFQSFQTEIETTINIADVRVKAMQEGLKARRQAFNKRWQFSME